jgi:hypothetical protein
MGQCKYFKDVECSAFDCGSCSTFKDYQEKINGGLKFDLNKPRWDLLPLEPIKELVDVLTFGAEKYGPNNWRNVDDAFNRYYAALMRHIVAYKSGELYDPESKRSHIAHALCNLIFLFELQEWP